MAKATLKKKLQFWGTGRRKKAIARVRLIPAGSGNIVINERAFEDYFPQSVLRYDVMQPLALLKAEGKYDVYVNVYGGGLTGQAGAIRLGISALFFRQSPIAVPPLKRPVSLPAIPASKSAKSTVSKRHVALLSSPRDKLSFSSGEVAALPPQIILCVICARQMPRAYFFCRNVFCACFKRLSRLNRSLNRFCVLNFGRQ